MSEVKPQPLVTFDNDPSNNKEVEEMLDENGQMIEDASLVQQVLKLKTNLKLKTGDILRKKI